MGKFLLAPAILAAAWAVAQGSYAAIQVRRLEAIECRLRQTHPGYVPNRSYTRFGDPVHQLRVSFLEDFVAWVGKCRGWGSKLTDSYGVHAYTIVEFTDACVYKSKPHGFLWSPRRREWVPWWSSCGDVGCPWDPPVTACFVRDTEKSSSDKAEGPGSADPFEDLPRRARVLMYSDCRLIASPAP